MSVVERGKIDRMGLTQDQETLMLLLSDHLPWDNEREHFVVLQDKINTYVYFWESEQYKKTYPNEKIRACIIQAHFMYPLNEKATRFIKAVNAQLFNANIKIVAYHDGKYIL